MAPEWGKITCGEIVKAVAGTLAFGEPDRLLSGFSSDSRTTKVKELFWALEGDRFDGHDFVVRAVQKGAAGVVVKNDFEIPPKAHHFAMIRVEDTLRALGDLAAWWRRQHSAKVIGITGSSGKTTTKEMVTHILELSHETLKNPGNHNNLIGLPTTLIQLKETHERAVLEMGMNQKGEIARLTQIASPDVGAILNVGMAHVEGLGDMEGVAAAKTELLAKITPGSQVVLNGDDALLMRHAARFETPTMTFGLKDSYAVQAINIQNFGVKGTGFDLKFQDHIWPVRLHVPGLHNIQNALAAAAIALCLKEPPQNIVEGLEAFRGVQGRFETIRLRNDILLINDTYNANPSSLSSALQSAGTMVPDKGRMLVGLGDMLELGNTAGDAHQKAGERVARAGAARLYIIGSHAAVVKKGAMDSGMPEKSIFAAETHEELLNRMLRDLTAKDLVFIKGSRKMQMEKITGGLLKRLGIDRKKCM